MSIENYISKNSIKYYDYEDFYCNDEICSGSLAKVYHAKYKNSCESVILKYLFNLNEITAKEIVKEVLNISIHILRYSKYIIIFQ